jgi:septal ring factor EnvC (AmiA/AmiB activator)
MTSTEVSFLLWGCGALLAILAFIGALAVKQLMQMAHDINEIKVTIARVDTKHDALEDRVERLEKFVQV